jgi:hypothetical protein
MEINMKDFLEAITSISKGVDQIEKALWNKSSRYADFQHGIEDSKHGLMILKDLLDTEVQNDLKKKRDLKEQADKLDSIISRLKVKFPDYIYINGITGECREKHMLPVDTDDFNIFVKGIPAGGSGALTDFIYDEIYMNLAQTDEPLPGVYTFTNKD